MVDFSLTDEERQIRDTVREFIEREVMPLEPEVLQIHGGMGYTKELPIERWYRELRLLRIYEGTDEIQRRTIARNLLRGHARLGEIGE
jgi:alkylation response protein AidB-like acyl-CoA dehydrogenase